MTTAIVLIVNKALGKKHPTIVLRKYSDGHLARRELYDMLAIANGKTNVCCGTNFDIVGFADMLLTREGWKIHPYDPGNCFLGSDYKFKVTFDSKTWFVKEI